MRDEIDARIWVEHHAEFSAFIDQLIDTIRVSLKRLHAIQFEAPWRRSSSVPAE